MWGRDVDEFEVSAGSCENGTCIVRKEVQICQAVSKFRPLAVIVNNERQYGKIILNRAHLQYEL